MQVKQAVMARIDSLDLLTPDSSSKLNIVILQIALDPGQLPATSLFTGENSVIYYSGSNEQPGMPQIQITQSAFEGISQGFGTNTRADLEWPVQVTIIDSANRDPLVNDDHYSKVRQDLMLAFAGQPLPGVPNVWYTRVEPMWMVNTDAFLGKNLFTSGIVFRFYEHLNTNNVTPDPAPITPDPLLTP
jgi:hypothetical protein